MARAAAATKSALLQRHGFRPTEPKSAILGVNRPDGSISAARAVQMKQIPIGMGLAAASVLTRP